MANRARDWFAQSGHDLNHARNALHDEDYDWACFAAHQAAEKAVKALFLDLNGEAWGHAITRLLTDLRGRIDVPEVLIKAAQRLDKHYIPTRYPNGFDTGAPRDYYTEEEAQRAIDDARNIYDFVQQSLSGSGRGD